MRTKNASCQVRLLHSKCSIFLEMSKHHQLPHKCSSSTLCPGKNNLWGIVKSWQPWGSRNNKGVTKHWWHQNTWAKSPHNDQKWTKGRSENASGTFFYVRSFARICACFARICNRFAPILWALQPCFLKNVRFAMTNATTNWKASQLSQHSNPQGWYFCVQSDPVTHKCTRNTHTHRPHLETWGDMEPMRPTGSKKCSSFQKTQIAQTQSN